MNNNLAIIYFLDFENLPSAPDCWHSWQTSRYINYILQALAVCAYLLLLSSYIKKWNTLLPGAVKVVARSATQKQLPIYPPATPPSAIYHQIPLGTETYICYIPVIHS